MADYDDNKEDLKPFTLFNNETGISYEIPVSLLNKVKGFKLSLLSS